MLPDEPEAMGLLALLLLLDARRAARFTSDQQLVVLAKQDRSLWDRASIDHGQGLLRRCLSLGKPGPFQLQAAINAVHADASRAGDTDWPQILTLYNHLFALAPSPVVALNRAVALAEVSGAEAALLAIEPLQLTQYYLFHAVRGHFLERVGRNADAAQAYASAIDLTQNRAERDHLTARIRELGVE
jgi:RNA polymerase sigma-70 factor, ECF subfamily